MKKGFFLIAGVICSLFYYSCRLRSEGKPDNPINPETRADLKLIQDGYSFTEGPTVDKKGNVFFTDQPNDKIFRWDEQSGDVSLFLEGTGRSNGMAFDRDGNIIACADMHGELWKIYPDGTHDVLVDNYNGKLLNGPNDVWINPKTGGIYITDPMFPRPYWEASDPRTANSWPPTHSEQGSGIAGHVYYLAPGSSSLVRVTPEDGIWSPDDSFPNGVVGTPDGKKLYVNRWTGDNMGGTFVFDINSDGTLSNIEKFVDMGGDGMSMDELGNVYISNGFGVVAFNKEGQEVLRVDTGGGATNNVFAGRNEKILFITGPRDRVQSVKMNVKGVEKFKHN
ncbi:SMP-30/gluconolactonase/LRE family protein [Thalassobellus sediminis]|uniref:SMP-30/gluconolactonase/LRE family protein n=1 Tax=Thalassobellus sediminis TaxID=3367753 RepID=UPI0037BAF819